MILSIFLWRSEIVFAQSSVLGENINISPSASSTIKYSVFVDGQRTLFTCLIIDKEAKTVLINGHPDLFFDELIIPGEVTLHEEEVTESGDRIFEKFRCLHRGTCRGFNNKMIGSVIIPEL